VLKQVHDELRAATGERTLGGEVQPPLNWGRAHLTGRYTELCRHSHTQVCHANPHIMTAVMPSRPVPQQCNKQ
jgi:hypothetical protein